MNTQKINTQKIQSNIQPVQASDQKMCIRDSSKAEAIGYFSTEAFRLSTSEEYGALLKELSSPETYEALDDAIKVTVRRELRDYERFCRVPEDLDVYKRQLQRSVSAYIPAQYV